MLSRLIVESGYDTNSTFGVGSSLMMRVPFNPIYTLSYSITMIIILLSCFRHPDKNKDPEAEEKFVEIKQAYEVSSLIFLNYN